MNAVEVLHELERLHPDNEGEWSFHREVFGIDAYAVRLWQGRDAPHYRRVAYEVKVSRSDFLAEMRSPEKRRTALALSHHYYFAMPAALAERCLADVVLRAPEAGLLAVHPDLPPRGFGGGSPFVGCGSLGRVRVLRKARIRRCRGWTAHEWSNLMRRQHAPAAEEHDLRLRMELAEEQAKRDRGAVRRAERQRDDALAMLTHLAERLVEPGQVWRGVRGRSRWDARDREDFVRAVVVEGGVGLAARPWARGSVRLRVVDAAGEPQVGLDADVVVSAGEFLAGWAMEGSGHEPSTREELDERLAGLRSRAGVG